MPSRSDFFTAKLVNGEYDRVYTADRFANRFNKLFTNGVIVSGGGIIDTELQVSIINGTMKSSVAIGSAIINGYGFEVFENPVELTHSDASAIYQRIDRIILELNLADDARSIDLKILAGVASAIPAAPALTRNDTVYQLSLAKILIPANVVSIPDGNITDERKDETLCGIANVAIGISAPDGNSASIIAITDLDGHFTSGTVEGALAENAVKINNKLSKNADTLESYSEKLVVATGVSGTYTMDLSVACNYQLTLSGATTLAFSNVPAGKTVSVTVTIIQPASAKAITYPSSFRWSDGKIGDVSTASKAHILTTMFVPSLNLWFASVINKFALS